MSYLPYSQARERAFIERLGRLLFLHDWHQRNPTSETFDREGLVQWLKDAGADGSNLDPDAYRLVVGDTQLREMGFLRPSGTKKAPRVGGHSYTEAAEKLLYRMEGANGLTLASLAGDQVFRKHVRGLDVGIDEVEKQGVALANYVFTRAVGEHPGLIVPNIAD